MSCFAEEKVLDHAYLLSVIDYDPENGQFTWKQHRGGCIPGELAGSPHPRGYWIISVDHVKYLAHRLAWFYVTSKWPVDEIDHRDGDKRNNRFDNLREATRCQNSYNHKTRVDNTSGVRGVSWRESKGKWRAYIQIDRKNHHLGYFDSRDDAIAARNHAAITMFGEFAGELRHDL